MSNGPYIVDETCLVFAKNIETENEELRAKIEKLRNSYNQAIDDAADLLNCVDLPRDELAAAVRRLKK